MIVANPRVLDSTVFDAAAPDLARRLIGCELFVEGVGGRIVETEAYTADDPASHSFAGRTARNATMFGRPGLAYVYRSYGLHWCLNIVAGEPGSAVLLRALEPLQGTSEMSARRGAASPRLLCSGPGRLCQALGVTGALDGKHVMDWHFQIVDRAAPPQIVVGPRIGISRATESPWRFGLSGSPALSRPFR